MKLALFALPAILAAAATYAADPKPDDAGPPSNEAETKAIDDLSKLGIQARPIAAGINWRYASARQTSNAKLDPKVFTLLKDVTNLQELDLGGVQLTDADLAQLAGLTNLRVLHLEKAPTTD